MGSQDALLGKKMAGNGVAQYRQEFLIICNRKNAGATLVRRPCAGGLVRLVRGPCARLWRELVP